MQILPIHNSSVKNTPLGEQLFAALGQGDTNDAFAQEFARQHAGPVASSEVVPVDAQPIHEPPIQPVAYPNEAPLAKAPLAKTPLAEAPYTRNTTDGVTYSLQEVLFTKQELHDLYRTLTKAGAPTESLIGLAALLELPDGASLAQVMASLKGRRAGGTLDESEQGAVKSLCDKIDPNGALSAHIAALLQNGKTGEAWQQISKALSAQPDATISIERTELVALGKALGLFGATQQQIVSNFGPHDSLTLFAAQLDAVLGPAQGEFNTRQQNQGKLDKALDATLTPMLQKARKRMDAEKSAGALSSRRTEQSKVLITKRVMRNVNESLHDAVKGDAQDNTKEAGLTQATAIRPAQSGNPQAPQASSAPQAPQAREGVRHDTRHSDTREVRHTTADRHEAGQRDTSDKVLGGDRLDRQNTRNNSHGQNGPNGQDGRDSRNDSDTPRQRDAWDPLLRKTDVRAEASSRTSATSATGDMGDGYNAGVSGVQGASGTNGVQAGTPSMGGAGTARPGISSQALSQVEQALLSALRDGTKRLELQLDPSDLGTLSLTLISRNGEVSAVIRSGRNETAEMLGRQLDVLRTNLEQQGIKVDKLEVQNQAADQRHNAWDSMQQHNAWQEENTRRETLEHWRKLGRWISSRDDTINNDAVLEQTMQSTGYTAENAARIYLVA